MNSTKMIRLDAGIAGKELIAMLKDTEQRHIPFAISRAQNMTVKAIQDALIAKLPQTFRTTRKWWGKSQPFGIKAAFSDKKNLTASVFTKAHFAVLQEQGGVKRPSSQKRANRYIAVPDYDQTPAALLKNYVGRSGIQRAYNVKSSYGIPARKRQDGSRIKAKSGSKHPFVIQRQDGRQLVMRRIASRQSRDIDNGLEFLYSLHTSVNVPPRWNFIKDSEAIAQKVFEDFFVWYFLEAVRG